MKVNAPASLKRLQSSVSRMQSSCQSPLCGVKVGVYHNLEAGSEDTIFGGSGGHHGIAAIAMAYYSN